MLLMPATLPQVASAAKAARVVLKGDLPIGVDKRSTDTWCDPQLFRMDKSTGGRERERGRWLLGWCMDGVCRRCVASPLARPWEDTARGSSK